MSNKIVLSFKEYLRRQLEQILSPENKWFAGERLKREPTTEEAAEHFAQYGGAEHFAKEYEYKNPSSQKSGERMDSQEIV